MSGKIKVRYRSHTVVTLLTSRRPGITFERVIDDYPYASHGISRGREVRPPAPGRVARMSTLTEAFGTHWLMLRKRMGH